MQMCESECLDWCRLGGEGGPEGMSTEGLELQKVELSSGQMFP
jgi:hypothetical protein